MVIRVIAVGAAFALVGGAMYYTKANASIEKAHHNDAGDASTKQLQRELGALRKELYNLRADNASLRSEVTTLTSQNGVVDMIIGHLRELKAQDQAILGMIQPASDSYAHEQDESGPEMPEGGLQGTARHQIVTPKEKAPPLPTPRPDKVAEAGGDKDAKQAKDAAKSAPTE